MKRSRILIVCGLLAVLVACARNPVTGRPELVLVSARAERELGLREAQKVERTMGLVEEAALVAWVQTVGERLAAHSPRQDVSYRFHVVDAAEPNAFALPGGPVYVSRGLLALVNDEAELACVLGHEIGHVAARHSVRRLTVGAPFALAFGVPSAVVGSVSRTLGGVVGGVGAALSQGLVLAPYSREQERQADRIGIEIAAKAGWDPGAMARFLTTLERETELMRGTSRRPSFFDSHPSAPARVADTARRAQGLTPAPARPVAGSRAALLRRLDGLLVGPNPAQGVFDDGLFLHPGLAFALRFPADWKTESTRQFVAGKHPEAAETYAILQLAGDGDDPAAGARADGIDEERLAQARRLQVSGLPALRWTTRSRGHGVDLTWIAHGGRVYRVAGVAPETRFEAALPQLRAVAESFRPLRPDDARRIRALRLRIRRARGGEALPALLERSGSAWPPAQVAVANALEEGARLREGQLVKVAVSEPYTR